MEAKPRLILALLMSSVMVCMVTLLVTFLDLGLRSDFLLQWAKAYFIACRSRRRRRSLSCRRRDASRIALWTDRRPALMLCAFSCCPLVAAHAFGARPLSQP